MSTAVRFFGLVEVGLALALVVSALLGVALARPFPVDLPLVASGHLIITVSSRIMVGSEESLGRASQVAQVARLLDVILHVLDLVLKLLSGLLDLLVRTVVVDLVLELVEVGGVVDELLLLLLSLLDLLPELHLALLPHLVLQTLRHVLVDGQAGLLVLEVLLLLLNHAVGFLHELFTG